MSLRRYRMYAGGTVTAAAIDSMQCVRQGKIKQILIASTYVSITAGANVRFELSRQSTSSVSNPAAGLVFLTQALAQTAWSGNFVTSGLGQSTGVEQFNLDDPVQLGDIIYIHANVAGTVTWQCDIIITIDERA